MEQLRVRLADDMKTAMREKATDRLSTIRMIRAEILTKDKERGNESSEEEILKILQSMVKRRGEAAEQFEKGNRPDLAAKEREEVLVLQGYLPTQMDDETILQAAQSAIGAMGITSIKEMGKVMSVLSKQLAGQAAGARTSRIVKEILTP